MNYVIVIIVLIGVIYFIVGYSLEKSFSFKSSTYGVVESVYFGNRDPSAVVKFKGTNNYYKLVSFDVPTEKRNLLKKGDSIFKPMFSKEAYIYRKDEKGQYYLNTKVGIK